MPAGNDDVVMVKAGALIVSDRLAVADADALSVTFTAKLAVPAAVGVPDIVLPVRLRPAGSDPLATDHVYGAVPPVALSSCEYAVPTVPAGNDAVIIFKGGALIVNETLAVADPDTLSVTCTVKLDEPEVLGVPDIVLPARLRPAGSDPLATDHVYGEDPPVASSCCEYDVPIVPAGNDVVVTAGGEATASDSPLVAVPPPLSANCAVKLAVPALDGVPLITPVGPARRRPWGRLP